ncbi:hypothetical protein ASPZODRAFT_137504 [Penicilliopsis zonata CBS 506.65]|uniref:CBM-cenC domain-containing protein n=1 Tax=Penicilliopsis zonata CBS 506.65 TaxID=1073090 RepID=A0A1L9S4J4_9EURO|nr:hypothetical protein ASPZODRAFT_137504 [Penicilliopsis zonata CBS 506.65]OJJ42086.1 hypothetical protein ASPZODRAFT_137504 [Penicilliopsis zonata CBS 506.65]
MLFYTLLFSLLSPLARATVTCTTTEINGWQNPSFETGNVDDWTNLVATGAAADGSVVEGDGSSGSYYYSITGTGIYTYLSQDMAGLTEGQALMLSVDYRVFFTEDTSTTGDYCYIFFSTNSWDNLESAQTTVHPSAYESNPAWSTYTQTLTPTADTDEIYFTWGCSASYVELDLDNFQAVLGTTTSCTTVLPSSTPVTSSPASSSSIASSSSFLVTSSSVPSSPVTSSSAIPSTASSNLVPSSAAPSSASSSVSSSAVFPFTRSSSLAVLPSLPVSVASSAVSPASSAVASSSASVTTDAVFTTTSIVYVTEMATAYACPAPSAA